MTYETVAAVAHSAAEEYQGNTRAILCLLSLSELLLTGVPLSSAMLQAVILRQHTLCKAVCLTFKARRSRFFAITAKV